ncbi:MAG: HPr family phosphocarrier protein [Oscillospiraceae bacterium]|nr:HPr family phosphocarrier protein [Oscillospiraceae bacterium]
MVNKKINLDTIDKVQALVGAATEASFEIDILTDNFIVNAKSIMGIFSLDRSSPVNISINADEGDEGFKAFLERIGEYIVD